MGKVDNILKNKPTTKGVSLGCLGLGREQIWKLLVCILEIPFWSEFWVPGFIPLLSLPSPIPRDSPLFLPSPPKDAGCPQLRRDCEYLASISRCPRGFIHWLLSEDKTLKLKHHLSPGVYGSLSPLNTPHQPTQLHTLQAHSLTHTHMCRASPDPPGHDLRGLFRAMTDSCWKKVTGGGVFAGVPVAGINQLWVLQPQHTPESSGKSVGKPLFLPKGLP